MGEYHFYHDIDDKASAVTLSKYNEAYKLIFDYMKAYISQSISRNNNNKIEQKSE
jgi:hypothetical protein